MQTQPLRADRGPMNAPFQKPWTQEQFFAWGASQEDRYEFDGFQPVVMPGGNAGHSRITRNLLRALDARLRGGPCEPLGPDAGLETVNAAIRYPDGSGDLCEDRECRAPYWRCGRRLRGAQPDLRRRIDRIVKVREYAAVPSIRRDVILESASVGLTVLERESPDEAWRTTVLTNEDILRMPEIGIELPVADIYQDLTFGEGAGAHG